MPGSSRGRATAAGQLARPGDAAQRLWPSVGWSRLAVAWLLLLRVRRARVAGRDAARRVSLGCNGRCLANVAPASPFDPPTALNP